MNETPFPPRFPRGTSVPGDSSPQLLPGAVLPVSLLVASARLLIERHLGLVWVSGEISNFVRAASGHCYFNLKDAQAQARCVLFRQKAQHVQFTLRDGVQVEVRATPSIYEARGEFQLNVENVRLAGVGALYERFAQLKAKLEAAGWFAEARKRPLPSYPRAIGIVTSTRAAALRDILTTLRRRWPAARVVLYPTAVQGDGSAAEIARAIRTANARAEVDVLIVGRGGGSIEDLWAFNEEVLAQAVFDSMLPVVSGVGHETDFTICDFVADLRAPTPTAAAAAVTPDRIAVAHRVEQLARRLVPVGATCVGGPGATARRRHAPPRASRRAHRAGERTPARIRPENSSCVARGFLRATRSRQSTLQSRLLRELRAPLHPVLRVEHALARWQRAMHERGLRTVERLGGLAQNLAHLNPEAVLERGYAIVAASDGSIVQDARQVSQGDAVVLTFARGGADATITQRREQEP